MDRDRQRRFSAHIVARRESVLERGIDAAIRRPSLASVAERGNWGSRWEFLLSCVGLSVGIGNVWRFPYLAYQNGGGAFLIPYLIMLGLAGKPMYFLELAMGQFAGVGPVALWNCCPIAKGVGCAMVTVSLIVCIYYNVIMSYTVFYMVASFAAEVPWSKCDPAWADMSTCYVRQTSEAQNESRTNVSSETPYRETASLQYWEKQVLHLSDGVENIGPVKWDLALCLLFSWVIVVLCLVKGIKTSGKVVYFAATFPYLILFILLVTGLLQDGAMSGVLYFITPSWEKLLDIQVWQAAAGQMFFSLSVSMGGLIMYSSYNDFRNNVYRDAMVVSVLDTITSIISGMVTFSILGAMAHDLDVPINQVVKEGPGLAFVAYPEALLRLPVPQLWSVLFFLMLFVLGLDSEFALLENVLTSISDEFTVLRNHKLSFCIVTAVICYLVGLSCVTYVVQNRVGRIITSASRYTRITDITAALGLTRLQSYIQRLTRRQLHPHADGRLRRRRRRALHRHHGMHRPHLDIRAAEDLQRSAVHAGPAAGLLLEGHLGLLRARHLARHLRVLAGGLQAAALRGLRLPGLGGRHRLDAGLPVHASDPVLGCCQRVPDAGALTQEEVDHGDQAHRGLGSVGPEPAGRLAGDEQQVPGDASQLHVCVARLAELGGQGRGAPAQQHRQQPRLRGADMSVAVGRPSRPRDSLLDCTSQASVLRTPCVLCVMFRLRDAASRGVKYCMK